MDRRHFLSALSAGVAGLAFDPERLLWVPGKKTIFLPPVCVLTDREVGISLRFIRHFDVTQVTVVSWFDCAVPPQMGRAERVSV